MVLIIEIIVNPRNLLYINHKFRKGGKLVAKMVKHFSFVDINYRDNMAVTYQDIGFAIIAQPKSI